MLKALLKANNILYFSCLKYHFGAFCLCHTFFLYQNIQSKLLIKSKIQVFYLKKRSLTHYYIIITLLIKI